MDIVSTTRRTPFYVLAVPLLAIVGMGISGYLTYVHWFAIQPFCGELGECEVVNSSVYAEVYGLPVALLGFLTYSALVTLGIMNIRYDGRFRPAIMPAILGLSLAGVLYSAYLTHIELNVLEAICVWCVASATTISAILILSAVMAVKQRRA